MRARCLQQITLPDIYLGHMTGTLQVYKQAFWGCHKVMETSQELIIVTLASYLTTPIFYCGEPGAEAKSHDIELRIAIAYSAN